MRMYAALAISITHRKLAQTLLRSENPRLEFNCSMPIDRTIETFGVLVGRSRSTPTVGCTLYKLPKIPPGVKEVCTQQCTWCIFLFHRLCPKWVRFMGTSIDLWPFYFERFSSDLGSKLCCQWNFCPWWPPSWRHNLSSPSFHLTSSASARELGSPYRLDQLAAQHNGLETRSSTSLQHARHTSK